ncbi:hypothetical protein BDZ85DRAFT_193953 [Elsinoe ampelina]|uniref:dihydroneopterin aldolase n=1 Tax=Elsinoe ampelina TaxID=302913 RepID=A0A6A6GG81_9PEZI|nr:hypothetical protein BDZ85DRAFT_193953 [Elsinoe ampelina]
MDRAWCHDGIEISRLSLDHQHCVGTDAWGRRKEQPVLVSVRFSFRAGFDTAAETDSLDLSTVNYGSTSKSIKAIQPLKPWEALNDFAARVYQVVLQCLPGSRTVEACSIQVHLPKASLLGSEVTFTHSYQHLIGIVWPRLDRTLLLSKIHMPVLVGINENERQRKQPLFVSLWLSTVPAAAADTYSEVESKLCQIVEGTCFETLESLALFIVQGLHKKYLAEEAPQSTVRVRIKKPMAVPSASAPAIEVVRSPIELSQATLSKSIKEGGPGLKLVKPYLP